MKQLKHVAIGTLVLALVALPSLGAAPGTAEPGSRLEILKAEPVKDGLWKSASQKPITSAEIDKMIVSALDRAGVKPAAIISDEQFIRRVHLDLCGKLPTPEQIREFIADKDAKKRAKLIDKLLDSKAYARHWSRYWHDVMSARLVNNFQSRILARSFNTWMAEQLEKNRSWADVTRDMLTASGVARFDDTEGKSGASFFLASHMGADATVEQAAETARVFMGIQINCAQCHNHPFDVWKREQFHELAAYFARVRTRLVRDRESERIRFVGVELVSIDQAGGGRFGGGGFGRGGAREYRMPDKENPRNGKIMHPRSLDGKAPEKGLKDKDRRKSLVDSIVSKDNHWFSAAYVNRIWGVLIGQAFFNPVDDLGPQREAVHGAVLARLSGAFAGSGHDPKSLFRVIMNTQTYQRQSRVGTSAAEHLLFAHTYPTRLRPSAVVESVTHVIGPLGGGGGGGRPGMGAMGRFGLGGGLEGMIRNEFNFDPSLKNEDVEGSIPQALTLMNNPQLNNKIRAQGSNVVAKLLEVHEKDDAAIEEIYLRTLCRKPTARELKKCQAYVTKVGKRGEAFEDILWALLNSTEFLTRR